VDTATIGAGADAGGERGRGGDVRLGEVWRGSVVAERGGVGTVGAETGVADRQQPRGLAVTGGGDGVARGDLTAEIVEDAGRLPGSGEQEGEGEEGSGGNGGADEPVDATNGSPLPPR
jgi:hypothetical protein